MTPAPPAASRRRLGSYAFLLPYVLRYRRGLTVGAICLLVTNQLTGAIPWLTMKVVDGIAHGQPRRQLAWWILAIAGTAIVMAAFRTQSRLLILGMSRSVAYDVRRDVFAHLLRVRLASFDRMPTGDVMSRMANDLMLVRGLTGPGFMYLGNTLLAYATAISFMAVLDPYLTLLALVPFPFFFVTVWLLARRLHVRQKESQEELAKLSSRVQEDLGGVWVVKAHAREAFAEAAYESLNRGYADAQMRLVFLRSFLAPIMGTVGSVGALCVLLLGGHAVIRGSISLGGFVAFTGYLGIIAAPTVQMGWVITLFQRARVATERIQEILDLPVEEDARPGIPPASLHGDLEVKGLRFAYPDAARPVLDGLSFRVPAGTTVGIYGPTGSGKTTLLRLLARLHDPPPGTLFVGGRDLALMPRAAVRGSVAYVPQDPFLFRATIAENVAYVAGANGDGGGVHGPAIEAAARAASVHEEVAGFPLGYATVLGERGITLSGGQRLRVTLARALYAPRPLLLLDDPFAAVDTGTEDTIIRNLAARAQGVTTIMVTHRVKALAHTGRILVLQHGRIVDEGSHDELLARPGPYLEAFKEQRLEEELATL